MKTPTKFLCKKCLTKMREYDTKRKQQYRKLKIKKVGKQVSGKIKINKSGRQPNSQK